MRRNNRRPRFSNNLVESSSSESESNSDSNSDSDDSLELPTASDVINSFLNRSKAVLPNKVSKSRKASDIINSFLQKNKIVDRATTFQYESALDVINSYLRKDRFGNNQQTPSGSSISRTRRIESTDDSSSESDLDTRKRGRELIELSSSEDSDSPTDRNVPKRRRIEISHSTGTTINKSIEEISHEQLDCPADLIPSGLSPNRIPNDNPTVSRFEVIEDSGQNNQHDLTNCSISSEKIRQSRTATTRKRGCKSKSTKNSSKAKSKPKPKRNPIPEAFKMSFTREIRTKGKKEIVERQEIIRDTKIPKEKYDRALEILNSTECRYDETPVDYGLPKAQYDIRQNCTNRRHAEATYDHPKLGMSGQISLTRIVFELDNCLKRENWQEMAELIYFGCGLMKTGQSRRAIGTSFFTYALLLLLLDSSPSSLSTLDDKKNEIMKFLVALGSEPDENEEFLRELDLVTDNDLLVIMSERD